MNITSIRGLRVSSPSNAVDHAYAVPVFLVKRVLNPQLSLRLRVLSSCKTAKKHSPRKKEAAPGKPKQKAARSGPHPDTKEPDLVRVAISLQDHEVSPTDMGTPWRNAVTYQE